MEIKYCSCCLVPLPVSCFQKDKYYKDGYRGECKSCRKEKQLEYKKRPENLEKIRAWNRKSKKKNYRYGRSKMLESKYGITQDQFEQISEAQNHKCALCFFPASEMRHKKLCVDHCHETGRVRGLLCHPCNTLLGRIGDNVAGVTRMLEYVSRSEPGSLSPGTSSLGLVDVCSRQ